MRKIALIVGVLSLFSVAACSSDATAPPQLPSQITTVGRTAIETAANGFDAALYGLDFAMDAHLITPGSDQAKQIAAIGRKVQAALNGADAALAAGNATSAKDLLDQANAAIARFKLLLPHKNTSMLAPLRPVDRGAVLARAAG